MPERITDRDEEPFFLDTAEIGACQRAVFPGRGIGQIVCLEFRQSPFQVFLFNRFQQIVNAVYTECTQGIFIVCCCENDGSAHRHTLKHIKTQSVG